MNFGSSEHAESITQGRHEGVRDALQWLAFAHLPSTLQGYSEPFYTAAVELISRIGTDSPELTTALNRLVTAKDSAVRAGIRHDTGRAGSIPRPQSVVDPPTDWAKTARDLTSGDQDLIDEHLGVVDNRIGPNFGHPIQDRPQA